MSYRAHVVIIIRYDDELKCRSACGNLHVTTNMSSSILLDVSDPWVLAIGLFLIVLLTVCIGERRKYAKPEEEKVSTPTHVDPQIEVVEVGLKNTIKGVQLA